MTPESLKRQLLSMGSQAPELKLSLRVILDYLEDHEVRYLSAKMRTAVAEKYEHIDFKPPQSVADAAEKGLEYRRKQKGDKAGLTPEEAGEQGIGSGVQRAVNLKNRDELSPETIRQMSAFFARHEKNKSIDEEHKGEPWKDNGYVSWLLWGGDPGKSWVEGVIQKMEKADEKAKESSMSLRVAARYFLAFMPNVGNQLVGQIQKGLSSFLRHALNPFPESDPQRALSKLAGLVARKVDLPSHLSLSNRNAHEFLALLLREMDVRVSESDLEDAVQSVTGADLFVPGSIVGRLEAELESMLEDVSRDPSMGASRGQKKVVRLLTKQGLGDYEAMQVFAALVPQLDFDLKMRTDQINSLLSSFLEDSSQRAAAHWR